MVLVRLAYAAELPTPDEALKRRLREGEGRAAGGAPAAHGAKPVRWRSAGARLRATAAARRPARSGATGAGEPEASAKALPYWIESSRTWWRLPRPSAISS